MAEGATGKVSIVIANWNTRDLLRACLQSLPERAGELAVEVLVTDNGSSDGSAEMVVTEFPHVHLIRNADNRGFVQANNQGLRAATGDYLFMLNSDAELRPGVIEALVAAVDRDPQVGAAAPRLVYPDGSPQSSVQRFPRLVDWVMPAAVQHRRELAFDRALKLDRPATVDWIVGAALLFRRDVLERVGPLDERYFMWLDDIDWCRKVRAAGLRCVFEPAVAVVHHKAKSTSLLSAGQFREQVLDSEYLYLRLHHGRAATLLVFASRMLRALVQRLLARTPEAREQARRKLAYHRQHWRRCCLAAVPPRQDFPG